MESAVPPEMLQRFTELEAGFTARLANQREVIENLDTARKAALEKLAEWQEFGRMIAQLDDAVAAQSARDLLRQQGEEV